MDCLELLSPAKVVKVLVGNLRRLVEEHFEYLKDCWLDHKFHVSIAIPSRVVHMVAPRTETLPGLLNLWEQV